MNRKGAVLLLDDMELQAGALFAIDVEGDAWWRDRLICINGD